MDMTKNKNLEKFWITIIMYIFWRNLENLHNQIANILEKFLLQQISAILRDNPLCVTQKTPIEPTLGGMGSALRWVILESIYVPLENFQETFGWKIGFL